MKTARVKRNAAPRNQGSPRIARQPRTRPTATRTEPDDGTANQWTFLTNHAHVLILLSREPSLVLREVALHVGITERAVQRIIADLEASGIIDREKVGRQNHYRIRADQPLRHPIEAHRTIRELLLLINGGARKSR